MSRTAGSESPGAWRVSTQPVQGTPAGAGAQLYGRQEDAAALQAAWRAACDGSGGLVLLAGEAGIGKTSLVEAFVASARQDSAVVLTGHCYDLDSGSPLAPWAELLRNTSIEDGLAAQPERPRDPGLLMEIASTKDALADRIGTFLETLSGNYPVLLILEDLHWSDQASLELLRTIVRRVSNWRVLIIATFRDNELTLDQPLHRVLPQLVREGRPLRLDLRALTAQDIQGLVAARYQLPPVDEHRLVAHLLHYTEGNPFYLEELLRTLEHDQIVTLTATGWRLGELAQVSVPPLVRQLIDDRVARLGPSTQRLLQLAAVIGQVIPIEHWQAIAGVSDEVLAGAVEQAHSAQLLRETPDHTALAFTHALFREALYGSVSLLQRRAWHRQIADLLAERAAPEPEAIAAHLVQAGDSRAVEWLIRAGQRAERRDAARDAIARYEQALPFLERQGPSDALAWLHADLAESYRYVDLAKSTAHLDAAERTAQGTRDPLLVLAVRWLRARLRGFLGQRVLADLRDCVKALDALPPDERAELTRMGRLHVPSRGLLAQWLAFIGRYDEARVFAEAVLAEDADTTSPARRNELGGAHIALALADAGLGRPAAARAEFAAARDQFRALDSTFMTASTLKWEIIDVAMAYHADDLRERQRLLYDYEQSMARMTSFAVFSGSRPLLQVFGPATTEGRWDEVLEAGQAYLHVPAWRISALAALGEIERLRGDSDAAWGRVRAGIPGGPATEPGDLYFVDMLALQRLAAELCLDAGDLANGLAWIMAHERWLTWSGRLLNRAQGALLFARYHALNGELEMAETATERAATLAAAPRQPLALLAVERMQGALAIARGHLTAAEAHLEASLALADACAAPYERARTLIELAVLRQAEERHEDAVTALEEARQIATSLRAELVLQSIADLEAQVASTSDAGTSGLSPREVEVLRLVARGLSYAEIGTELYISPRTVARHLQSIYAKLSLDSRAEAAAYAYAHGIV
jgi:DNA-binding NarL/FixJ family response regulator